MGWEGENIREGERGKAARGKRVGKGHTGKGWGGVVRATDCRVMARVPPCNKV